MLNGLRGITSQGVSDILTCCKHTLWVFEAGLMN